METDEQAHERAPVRHPARRALAALLVVGLAAGAVAGVRQQVGLMDAQSKLQRAFQVGAVDGTRWKCGSDHSDGAFLFSCYPPTAAGPTVNYELLPAPETPDELDARVKEENRQARDQDSSGTTPTVTLVGTADWTPTGQDESWGTVTRWRYDGGGTRPGPLFRTTYRYADEPYGFTVFAASPSRIDELVRSLTLLPPDQLPD